MNARLAALFRERAASCQQLAKIDAAIADMLSSGENESAEVVVTQLDKQRAKKVLDKLEAQGGR